MTLLARVAENVYWAARYVERAEDTARVVRAYSDGVVDLPRSVAMSWEPLLAIAGSSDAYDTTSGARDEISIVRYLVAEASNGGSIASSVASARENLRTTREVLPREAWRSLNDLYLYVLGNIGDGVGRRSRSRVLGAIVDSSRRLDGVIDSTMIHDEAYQLWRLGRSIERADMTTRVIGVRAAALLSAGPDAEFDGVQWMSVLRSLSGLQMYQRASRRPIEGESVVQFLLFHRQFPRSVRACLDGMRSALAELPRPDDVIAAVDRAESALSDSTPIADGGAELDAAMDRVQVELWSLSAEIAARYLSPAERVAGR